MPQTIEPCTSQPVWQPPAIREIGDAGGDLGRGTDRRRVAVKDLAQVQLVLHVVVQDVAVERVEIPEKEERGGGQERRQPPPVGQLRQRRPQVARRLRRSPRLADEEQHGDERNEAQDAAAHEHRPQPAVIGDVAAEDARQERGRGHRAPLDRLDLAGEAPRLAFLDRRASMTTSLMAIPMPPAIISQPAQAMGLARSSQRPQSADFAAGDAAVPGGGQDQKGHGGQQRGEHQVRPAAAAAHRKKVGKQAKKRLNRPGDADNAEELADLRRAKRPQRSSWVCSG